MLKCEMQYNNHYRRPKNIFYLMSEYYIDRWAHRLTAAPAPHCAQTLISHNLCVQTFSHGCTKGEFTVS